MPDLSRTRKTDDDATPDQNKDSDEESQDIGGKETRTTTMLPSLKS